MKIIKNIYTIKTVSSGNSVRKKEER